MDPVREKFHLILKTFADNVYFQPPENSRIEYPCIVYKRDNANTKYADDKPYDIRTRYMVTVIDPNPDSEIPRMVASLPLSSFNRFYIAENLNHDVYSVFV
jgi:hypothetical protein